jgi:hypothetical protein
MSDVQLSIPERSALLALMTFRETASNPEIRDRYGFTIDRAVRESLEQEGYLKATQATRNTWIHELKDEGWARCRDELANPLPDRAPKAYRLLYGVLGCLDHYLTVNTLTLADLFNPQEQPVAEDATNGEPADKRLQAAYAELASRPGAWVGLARLREALPDLSRQEFDGALLEVALWPHVSLIPEVNQKALTGADRAAAIHVGGEDKHLLQIRPV